MKARRGSRAPPSAPSRETACSTSSCRRPPPWKIISSSLPPWKRPPKRCTSRFCLKATSRRAIRACCTFASRPDPGVIEVNIHPASSWDESERTDDVSLRSGARIPSRRRKNSCSTGATPAPAAAIISRSGGATPADSPWLRRPDLLRSFLSYWHNHPSLSYLFSGLFIGPTSQAPRIDEARNDSVREIEVAFREMERRARCRTGRLPALADRPAAAQFAHRRHRQHPSRRILHRQTLLAGQRHRASGAARNARLRDAAARAHEPDPTVVDCAR